MARDIFKSMSLFTPKEALQVSAAQARAKAGTCKAKLAKSTKYTSSKTQAGEGEGGLT